MWQNAFKQIMEIWITPEVMRRQQSGSIARPYDLQRAQVIFHADGRPNEIRLNEEVRFLATVKLKNDIPRKGEGDLAYAHGIESYESFRLPDGEDPNCGHITIVRIGDQWMIAFDAVYNKGMAARHLSAAQEFSTAAQQAVTNNLMRVFVDTCFSAAELAAKALLLTTPLPNKNTKMSHGRIHSRYNLEAKLGNVNASHKDVLNRLATLRGSARYLNNELDLSESEAGALIEAVQDAISFVARRVQIDRNA